MTQPAGHPSQLQTVPMDVLISLFTIKNEITIKPQISHLVTKTSSPSDISYSPMNKAIPANKIANKKDNNLSLPSIPGSKTCVEVGKEIGVFMK